MRSVLSMPGIFRVLKSSFILSLAYHYRPTVGEINAFNLCTQNHCGDCSASEVLKCSNGAIFDPRGDLCGCCQSCVQFQDLGETCGTQLAISSFKIFGDSNPRVTVFATTRCKEALVCENFVCKRFSGQMNAEIDDNRFSVLHSNLVTLESPNQLDSYTWVTGSRNVERNENKKLHGYSFQFTSSRAATTKSYQNKIPNERSKLAGKSSKNTILDRSDHVINLLIGERKLQLIYGHDALSDFNILIESIVKKPITSISKTYETEKLYKRSIEVLSQQLGGIKKSLDSEEYKNLTRAYFNVKNAEKSEKFNIIKSAKAVTVEPHFGPHAYTSKVSNSKISLRKIRSKRETNDAAKLVEIKTENTMKESRRKIHDKINNEFSGTSVYDIMNKDPSKIHDFGRWLSVRKMERNHNDKSLDSDESEINIQITGIPRMTNFAPDITQMREKKRENIRVQIGEEDKNADLLVSDANNDATVSKDEIKNSTNVATFETLRTHRNHDIAKSVPEEIAEKPQSFNNNLGFTFTKYPVTLDYNRDADSGVNGTTERLKAQLDRIETRAIIIENVVRAIIKKIDTNGRLKNINHAETNDDTNFAIVERRQMQNPNTSYDIIFQQGKAINTTKENHRSFSNGRKYQNFTSKNTGLKQFYPKRLNRQWSTNSFNFRDTPKFSRIRRRRPYRSDGHRSTWSETRSRGNEAPDDWAVSARRRHASSPRQPRIIIDLEDPASGLRKRKFPILLTKKNGKTSSLHNHQRDDSQLSPREQSDLAIDSNSPEERSFWPPNFVISQTLPVDRTNEQLKEGFRSGGRRPYSDTPVIEESVILLETQIPSSVGTSDSSIIDDKMETRSIRLITKYEGDDDDWNSSDDKYESNLFSANGGRAEFDAIAPRSRIPETLTLLLERSGMKKNHQQNNEVDDSHWLLSSLDYVEREQPKDKSGPTDDESAMVESSINSGNNESMNLTLNRTKRNTRDNSSSLQLRSDNAAKQKIICTKTVRPRCDNSSANIKTTSHYLESSKTTVNNMSSPKKWFTIQQVNGGTKNSSGRSRRSVQVADWLRAAQEYHERLRQLRAAAMKTWLVSREMFADEDFTNVKLFTRETDPYSETYRVTSFQENFDDIGDERIQDYPTEYPVDEDGMADSSEILTDILVDQSSPRENTSKPRGNENDEQRFIEVSNSSGPRKLTIITNGNSTIRIEEVPNGDDDAERLEDQSAQGSSDDELSHEIPSMASDTDYFDHMYESFNTDDENFNYEDSGSITSGWFNDFDLIDSLDEEDTERDHTPVNAHEKEFESLARYKRDSPLILFKANGNLKRDILIWPSNWKDLIHRHLKFRSGNNLTKNTKKRGYLSNRKIVSMPAVASSLESIGKSDQQEDQP